MRFEELVITIQDEELRVPFHPELTILSGIAVLERQSLADSFLGALTAGTETTTLRYTDGEGRPVTLVCRDGRASGSFDDGTPAPTPIGSVAATPAELRSLLLVRASDLGVLDVTPRDDEPPELQEARATLAELSNELDDALRAQQSQADARARLDELDELIATARDGAARREYAHVLARLERVRAEAAAVQSGASGIENDRHLLSASSEARHLAERWRAAADRLTELTDRFGATERLSSDDLGAATVIPDEPPADLEVLTAAAAAAGAERAALDHLLQELAVATLPAPSDPVVAELGLVDQHELWGTAERVMTALDEVDRLHVAHGGLGVDESGPGPAVIDEIETAHRDLEVAEQAAESTRVLGVAASGLGIAIALAGVLSSAVLIALGLVIALGAGMALLVMPKQRIARAARAEEVVLTRAGAGSYLGFHMRRVDASVDPHMREQVSVALVEQRRASTAWEELVGPGIDPRQASRLEPEIRAYNEALRSLGGAADEIEQLRAELAERAEPALAQAMEVLRARCEPFGLRAADFDHLDALRGRVAERIHVGRTARLQVELEDAEADELKAASRLDDLLLQLGFGDGELDARLGALEWAVSHAAEREESRTRARPTADIEAEQRDLESTARSLRRPEWDTVTAADAETPDIAGLEAERRELMGQPVDTSSDEEIERLADRHAAIERRVVALEARSGGHDANGDPGAVADIQQNLLARLAAAAEAGPHGDPVPMILDEALLRVPADRKWDLLDLLLRLAEHHQLVYLSDDAFVAAWARQQAAEGNITLLEPSPD